MKKFGRAIDRRDLLRAVAVTGATATAGALVREADAAEPTARDEKRKARYQPNSAEIQQFYRVNGYPPRARRSSC